MEYHNNKTLPCDHQIGAPVTANFGEAGTIKNCNVIKVHFTNGGFETYDLLVNMFSDDDGKPNYTRLYNIPRLLVDADESR